MKTYVKLLLCIAFYAAVFGVFGPMLVSAKSDALVLAGFLLVAGLPPALYFIVTYGKKVKSRKGK